MAQSQPQPQDVVQTADYNKGLFIVAHLNCRSLYPKLDEMKDLLTRWTGSGQNVVLGLSKTWLSESVDDGVVSVDGYIIHRRDGVGKAGGGVLIFASDNIKSARRRDLEVAGIELIWVEVRIAGRCLLVGNVYRPPRSSNEWMDSMHCILDRALQEKVDVILLGDFNCNLLKQDSRTGLLCSIMSELNYSQFIEEATRVTQTSSSLIDFCTQTTRTYFCCVDAPV